MSAKELDNKQVETKSVEFFESNTSTNDENSYNALRTLKGFKECIMADDKNIDLKKFVIAYRELIKFLNDLSKFFKFCSDDLERKCRFIDELVDINPVHYSTVQSAVEFEKSVGLHERHNLATISILRLMRGLDFTRRLMDDAYENIDTKKKCYDIAWEAYEKTLAFRQKWTVKNSIKIGFHVLPKKKEMLDFMLRGAPPHKSHRENDYILKEFLSVVHKVYYLVHRTFYENDFLELVFN